MRVIARRTLRKFVESLSRHKDQPAVKAALEGDKATVLEERYQYNFGALLGQVWCGLASHACGQG